MLSQLQVFLLAANFESDRMTSHKHRQAAKTGPKWRPPKSIFQDEFLRVADTSEAETSVSRKAEYLQKSKLSGVTFSFNPIGSLC